MTRRGPLNPERSFGVSVGPVLLAVAGYSIWRGRFAVAATLGFVGGLLFVLGLARPSLLKRPSAAWWRFSRALGHVNARVLLTALFALVFVPIGLVWRITRRDPLHRYPARFPGWVSHPARYRDRNHYSRMY